jgi:hypothetical protein
VVHLAVIKIVNLILFGVWYDQKLTYENWFPVDKFDPFGYNVLLVWQYFLSILFFCGIVGSVLILNALVALIAMNFDILSMKLAKFKPYEDKSKFKELLMEHEKLMKLSKDVEEIFSPSILFNVTASSMLICFISYELSIKFDLEFVLKLSIRLTAALLQILMVCNCGQKLTNAADGIRNAVYNCDWTNDLKHMRTTLVMTIQRAQKATVLTAYKFSVVNLAGFTVVSKQKLLNLILKAIFMFASISKFSFDSYRC